MTQIKKHQGPPARDSSREEKLAWLQWNDKNGTYTDANSNMEGMPLLTDSEAWDYILKSQKEC